MVVGIPLGILSAVKRDTIFDNLGKFFAVAGIAAPSFWIAIMLILLFGGILGWLPTLAEVVSTTSSCRLSCCPGTAWAGVLRLSRSSMLEVLDSEYVKLARIKGLPERIVVYKHALKNAIIPVLTFSGLTLAASSTAR